MSVLTVCSISLSCCFPPASLFKFRERGWKSGFFLRSLISTTFSSIDLLVTEGNTQAPKPSLLFSSYLFQQINRLPDDGITINMDLHFKNPVFPDRQYIPSKHTVYLSSGAPVNVVDSYFLSSLFFFHMTLLIGTWSRILISGLK